MSHHQLEPRCFHLRVAEVQARENSSPVPVSYAATICGRVVDYQRACGHPDNVCCPECVAKIHEKCEPTRCWPELDDCPKREPIPLDGAFADLSAQTRPRLQEMSEKFIGISPEAARTTDFGRLVLEAAHQYAIEMVCEAIATGQFPEFMPKGGLSREFAAHIKSYYLEPW